MTANPPSTLDPARANGPDPSDAAASLPGDAVRSNLRDRSLRERQPLLPRFGRDEEGATAIEYALMAMFFSVTVIGGSSSIRNALQTAFTTVSTAILGATNG